MRTFRNFFDDWVLSTLNYQPVSIWSIFDATKTFIKSESHTPLNRLQKLDYELLYLTKKICLNVQNNCQIWVNGSSSNKKK